MAKTRPQFEGYIQIGYLSGAHGVKGDAKLKSLLEDGDMIFSIKPLYREQAGSLVETVVKKRGRAGDDYIVSCDHISTREEALAHKGTALYIARDRLKEPEVDEYYLSDLEGLEARTKEGAKLGRVRAVQNYGAGDLLELHLDVSVAGLGRYVFLPFRAEFVVEVAIDQGYVMVDLPLWQAQQLVAEAHEKEQADKG